MPKKITNPLTEGMPSKIYYATYSKPINRYKIAKIIYGVEKFPPSAKIYAKDSWVNKLQKNGYLKKVEEDKFLSCEEPLARAIENVLQEKKFFLNELEKYALRKILDSKEFRMSADKKNLGKGDLCAADALVLNLWAFAFSSYIYKKLSPTFERLEPKNAEEFDRLWNGFREKHTELCKDKDYPKLISYFQDMFLGLVKLLLPERKKEIEGIKIDIPFLSPFMVVPVTLLKKLVKLWPFGDTFLIQFSEIISAYIGIYIFSIEKKLELSKEESKAVLAAAQKVYKFLSSET